MSAKVSVIIPVYNVERHISRCISSLKAQALDGLEFIFIDDCGEDSSMKYVEEFAANDRRVRIIRNKKNQGAGASRNAGIDAAKGKYLSFVDPDDYISSDFYVRLYAKAILTGAEVVKCRCIVDGSMMRLMANPDGLLKKNLKHGFPVYYSFSSKHFSAIYKRELFENPLARYGTAAYGEDTTFLLRILYGVKKFAYDEHASYYYCIHGENVTTSFTPKRCMEELASLKDKLDFLLTKPQDKYSSLYIRIKLRYCLWSFCFMSDVKGLWEADNEASRNIINTYSSELKKQLDRLPRHVLSVKFLEEITIFIRYREFVPTYPKVANKFDEWRTKAWTDFLVRHPDTKNDLIRGYTYMVLSNILTSMKAPEAGRSKKLDYTRFICEQYGRLDKRQRLKVVLFLPCCIASYIKRTIRFNILGTTE